MANLLAARVKKRRMIHVESPPIPSTGKLKTSNSAPSRNTLANPKVATNSAVLFQLLVCTERYFLPKAKCPNRDDFLRGTFVRQDAEPENEAPFFRRVSTLLIPPLNIAFTEGCRQDRGGRSSILLELRCQALNVADRCFAGEMFADVSRGAGFTDNGPVLKQRNHFGGLCMVLDS